MILTNEPADNDAKSTYLFFSRLRETNKGIFRYRNVLIAINFPCHILTQRSVFAILISGQIIFLVIAFEDIKEEHFLAQISFNKIAKKRCIHQMRFIAPDAIKAHNQIKCP